MSYKSQVRRDLKDGKKITPLSALRQYGCLRLADVIHKLRKEGMNIITGERTQKGKTFACYYLADIEHQGPGRPRGNIDKLAKQAGPAGPLGTL